MSAPSVSADVSAVLDRLGAPRAAWTGGTRKVRSPITGEEIGAAREHSAAQTTAAIGRAQLRKLPGWQ